MCMESYSNVINFNFHWRTDFTKIFASLDRANLENAKH
jgi:hypothetical protein